MSLRNAFGVVLGNLPARAGALLALLVLPLIAGGVPLTFTDEGLVIDAGGIVRFTMGYPQLCDDAGKEIHPVIEKVVAESTATVKYQGGAVVKLVSDEGRIGVEVSSPAGDVRKLLFQTLIPFQFSEDGTWRIDDNQEKPFPASQPAEAKLYGGTAERLVFKSGDGIGIAVVSPPYAWNELFDFRPWNWKTFAWKLHVPLDVDHPVFHIEISSRGTASAASVRYDRFGQAVKGDWPGKLKSEAELKADASTEKAYYDSFHPPQLDPFGGQPGSGPRLGLKKTGFFHVEKNDGKWRLVDPAGNLFFHLGICCFSTTSHTYIGKRHSAFEWIPPFDGDYRTAYYPYGNGAYSRDDFSFHLANLIRKYGGPIDDDAYVARIIPRVRRWGFNSAGAFSQPSHQALTAAQFPYVAELPVHPWDGLDPLPGLNRVLDPFDDTIRAKFERLCAERVAPLASDPLLIGYFLENEPLYEDVPRVIAGLKGSENPCKRRFIDFLREKYGRIDAFNTAWSLAAAGFDDLLDQGLAVATPAARADLQAYTDFFFETYFSWMEATFRKYDPNHLLIGNRLQMGTINNESLCRIMGRHVDVVSFNYYTHGIDQAFLDKIHAWTGEKPMILSEFYWGSTPDSGLPGAIRETNTQQERGLAYRNYVEQAAVLGYIVGVEWYTLVDQPASGVWYGKEQGENGNTGLFSIADRPWKEAVAEMAKTNLTIYPLLLGQRPPFVYDNPRFHAMGNPHLTVKVGRADGPVTVNGRTARWPGFPAVSLGSRLVQGANAGGVEAVFKTCRDDRRFYFIIHVVDPTPLQNTRSGADLWMGDGIELFFGTESFGTDGPLLPGDRHILIGASSANGKPEAYVVGAATQPDIETMVIPDADGKGYILEAAIPFEVIGVYPKTGDTILFDVALDDSTDGQKRLRQFVWNGIDRNSSERGQWGTAVFQ
jgi:hypothetical protein